jgi:hypothetical protein
MCGFCMTCFMSALSSDLADTWLNTNSITLSPTRAFKLEASPTFCPAAQITAASTSFRPGSPINSMPT